MTSQLDRMRILHVIPSVAERSGGPATAIVPMCRALMRQGIELLLLSTNDGLEQAPKGDAVEYKGLPALFFPAQFGASYKYSRRMTLWLKWNIQNFSLVHIHAVFNHSSVAAAQACRHAEVPYIVRPLGTLDPWSMSQKALRKRLFWQFSAKQMLCKATAVHYTSESEKLSTERSLGLNHGRVVPLGIEAVSEETEVTATSPDLASNPYVLFLSRLHPKKALDVLIDAFLALVESKQFAHWRLVIAGDGPPDYVAKLKAKAAASGSRKRIVFEGWLEGEKKSAVLRGASLLALPSYQENFGFCVMEALAHSVPVLVSPNVNLATEIASAKAGWITEIEKDALAARLAEALTDSKELARRGRAGKQLAEKYSWENTARELAKLYAEVLAPNRGDLYSIPSLSDSPKPGAMANRARI